jgi:hypothetical protein
VQHLQRAAGGAARGTGRKIHRGERHAQPPRARLQQVPVGDDHDARGQAPARELYAQVGADARGFARRDRDQRKLVF